MFPELPNFVTDDSPSFHQSLKYWGGRSNEIGSTIFGLASGMHEYQVTGSKHHIAGNMLSDAMAQAVKTFKSDKLLEEPLLKFSDAFNRIECYRDMLLTQTQMLGVEPMMDMVKDFEKTKKCRAKLSKASESLHVSWEKFAALPNISNLPERQQLDRYAHNMVTARQKYQLLLAEYTARLRDTNTHKKVTLLQRMLEHMLAEFSFFNYCSQILKELEPYMNALFEDVQKQLADCDKQTAIDEVARKKVELEIDENAKAERRLYPTGEQWPSAVQSTGRFFNKVGGLISTGAKDLKKYNTSRHKNEDWEVIDEPVKREVGEDIEVSSSLSATHFYLPLNEDDVPAQYLAEGQKKNTNDTTDENLTNQFASIENTTNQNKSTENQIVSMEDATNKNASTDTSLNNETTEIDHPLSNTHQTNVDGNTHQTNVDGFLKEKRKVTPDVPPLISHQDGFCTKGYLRIKQKAFPKSKYPLLYFIIDKKYGELLAQGQDQTQPSVFARLMLSSVRSIGVEEADRNYCFQIITSDAEHILQARNSVECEKWKQSLQDAIGAALDGNQERNRVRSVKEYQELRKRSNTCIDAVERIKVVDGNRYCSDCSCPRPGWASANLGVVFCIECSGIHRGLGVHVSKVKSLSLDKWTNDLVEAMESKGNKRVNEIYEANLGNAIKITRESSKSDRLQYITDKYVNKRFFSEEIQCANELFEKENTPVDLQEAESTVCLVPGCEGCNIHKTNEFKSSRLRVSPDHFQE